MLTTGELQEKRAELQAAVSSRHVPRMRIENQSHDKGAEILRVDREFAKASVTGDQTTAEALKTKSNQLRDELVDLEKILQAYRDGTLSVADDAVIMLGRDLHNEAAQTGRSFQAEHAQKLQTALELRKTFLAAIREIGECERNSLQCAAIVRETGRYASIPVAPTSLRPNSITNFAHTLTIQNEEVFESYGQVGSWYPQI